MRGRIALAVSAVAVAALGLSGVSAAAPQGHSPTIAKEYFGQADGTAVYRYTLSNSHGMKVQILSYGGIIQTLSVPDKHGKSANVVLGFPTLADYVAKNSPEAGGGVYFGALIGRYANRIAKGQFTLDGKTYNVPVNNNGNSLHGGLQGFDKKVWNVTEVPGKGTAGLKLTVTSPDGDQGYPGTLNATVTYTLDEQNRLSIGYQATTDAPTVVNLTNHTYWNLAGEASGDIYDQKLQLNAASYTPTDSTQIPTGQIVPVKGTPFDFTKPTAIGARIADNDPQLVIGQGYDHNWVLNSGGGKSLTQAAKATDPESGRTLTISTDQPGIQFYSGNFLDGTLYGTSGHAYRQGYGFALETQHYPDSPNQPDFPSTVLRPGETYHTTTVFALGTS
ncbi:galactose mutarotase [Amycolatopsis acidicola]|uniref:Aldose 1-epimerase n=1 Tax=Amycolatopsis acidicola TaxID=2596893 RepID=A0A5N0UNL3_9PSEU|nr:aldose epimerase family protein [Amycolatopsis acidicola]KAA9149454.1 galactose mutarotase [Amycolatopsis acidicola]